MTTNELNIAGISLGRTINTGNFDNLKVSVDVKRLENETDEELIARTQASLVQVIKANITEDNPIELENYQIRSLEREIEDLRKNIDKLEAPATAFKGYQEVLQQVILGLESIVGYFQHARDDVFEFTEKVFGKFNGVEDLDEQLDYTRRRMENMFFDHEEEAKKRLFPMVGIEEKEIE